MMGLEDIQVMETTGSHPGATVLVIGVADEHLAVLASRLGTGVPEHSTDYGAAIKTVRELQPDIVVVGLDTNFQAAIRLAPVIRAAVPEARLHAASIRADTRTARVALKTGYRSLIRLSAPSLPNPVSLPPRPDDALPTIKGAAALPPPLPKIEDQPPRENTDELVVQIASQTAAWTAEDLRRELDSTPDSSTQTRKNPPPPPRPTLAPGPPAASAPAASPGPDIRAHRGEIIAVLGAKGGCGGTFFAVQLAAELALSQSVCLVDLDVTAGDVAAALDVRTDRTLSEVMDKLDRLDGPMLHGLVTYVDKNLFILPQPLDLAEIDEMTGDAVMSLMTAASEVFPRVVMDCGARPDEAWLTAGLHADQVLFVSTPDVPSLRNTWRRVQLLDRLGVPRERLRLVVNRWHKKCLVRPEDMQDQLAIPLIAIIADDSKGANRALHNGKLLREVARRSPALGGIQVTARAVNETAAKPRGERG